jgi:adenosine deaminase
MFHTTLLNEYAHAQQIGLSENELAQLVGMAFDYAFVPEQQKCALQCIGQTKIRPVT